MRDFVRRIWNIFRGKTDALLTSLEDPEEQLSVFVSELSEQIQDMQRSVTSAIADEKRLHKQIEALGHKGTEWEARATGALEAGDEGLAKSALLKQHECDEEAATLRDAWTVQKQATTQLKDSLRLAKQRMEEARRKYNLLLAQYRSAQTKKKIHQTLTASQPESPMQMMDSLEEKIRQIEAETEAQLELEPGTAPDIEAQFHRIDQQRRGDEALAQLRSKIAQRSELPPGEAEGDVDRVAELKKALD